MGQVGLLGLAGLVCEPWLFVGIFWLLYQIQKFLQKEALVFDDPHVLDGRKVISDESVDFDDMTVINCSSILCKREAALS